MHLLDQRTLGIVMLLLLGMLVLIKHVATGSILDKPQGSVWIWLIHIFNMFFLLIANPLAALLLLTRALEVVDPTHLAIDLWWLLMGLEIGGMVVYLLGYLLMGWALISLGRKYQVGGSAPRAADTLVIADAYQFVRHPCTLRRCAFPWDLRA